MQFLKLYETLNDLSRLEKKFLANTFYSKYLIYNKGREVNYVENTFFIKSVKYFSKSYLKKKCLNGYSLNINMYLFKNKKNAACSFFGPVEEKRSFTSIKRFCKILETGQQMLVLVYSVIKGGFRVYSFNGIVGFLPKTQIRSLYRSVNFIVRLQLLSQCFSTFNFHFLWSICFISIIKVRSVRYTIKQKCKRKRYSNFLFLCPT